MSTLYENERALVWNPESGAEESLILPQEIDLVVTEGRYLEALKDSDGWKIIETNLKASIEDLKHKLAYEENLEKFRRLQEAVKAYSSVLQFVDAKIYEGRELSKPKPDRE